MGEQLGSLPPEWEPQIGFSNGIHGDTGLREVRFGNDSELSVRFTTLPMPDFFQSELQGKKIHNQIEFVRIQRFGDKSTVYFQPAKLSDKRRFPQAYTAFKTGAQEKLGTPLENWEFPLSEGDIYGLKQTGIFTVSDLSQAEAVQLSFMPDAHKAIAMAKLDMEELSAKDKAASESARADALEADMKQMKAEFEAKLQALSNQQSVDAAQMSKGVFGTDVAGEAPKATRSRNIKPITV